MSDPTNPTAKKKADFLIAFDKNAGNISQACRAIGINRSTFYDWKGEDDAFAQAVEDIEEGLIDWGESALKNRIIAGDTTAVIFFLKTKGKKRGYVERQEMALSGEVRHVLSMTELKKSMEETPK